MIERLLILGTGGDLVMRYLLPALLRMEMREGLPPDLEIVGTARRDSDDETYRVQRVARRRGHPRCLGAGFATAGGVRGRQWRTRPARARF